MDIPEPVQPATRAWSAGRAFRDALRELWFSPLVFILPSIGLLAMAGPLVALVISGIECVAMLGRTGHASRGGALR